MIGGFDYTTDNMLNSNINQKDKLYKKTAYHKKYIRDFNKKNTRKSFTKNNTGQTDNSSYSSESSESSEEPTLQTNTRTTQQKQFMQQFHQNPMMQQNPMTQQRQFMQQFHQTPMNHHNFQSTNQNNKIVQDHLEAIRARDNYAQNTLIMPGQISRDQSQNYIANQQQMQNSTNQFENQQYLNMFPRQIPMQQQMSMQQQIPMQQQMTMQDQPFNQMQGGSKKKNFS